MKYLIVGVAVFVDPCRIKAFDAFALGTVQNGASINLAFSPEDNRGKKAIFSVQQDDLTVHRMENGWLFTSLPGKPTAWLSATARYDELTAFPPLSDENGTARREEQLTILLRTALECGFTLRGILTLHSACMELGGAAVCFTGDSGVGKSTRAKMWVDTLGAEFISGDRPAIRIEKSGAVACGVPWDGKEQIFRNVERPLKAVFEVRRAPFTRIRRLTNAQAYRVLVRQVFIPMWDTEAAAAALANLRAFIRQTPVYRLFCGPDADAARETYEILFNHPERIMEDEREMKIREGFTLRNVVGESIVMPTGENIKKFDGTVVLNEVSAYIFEQLKRPLSREDLLALILSEFDVDKETAARDLDALLAKFSEFGMLDEENV